MTQATSIELQALVDSHDQPYQVIDADYRIVAVNRAFQAWYGIESEDAIGAPCFRITHGRSRPCGQDGESCPLSRVITQGERYSGVRERTGRDGTHGRVRQVAIPLTTNDGRRLMGRVLIRESQPDYGEPLSQIEQRQIRRLIERCSGNRRRVAERLGISERTLYRRLKTYGIT